jgi:hypothetical protein
MLGAKKMDMNQTIAIYRQAIDQTARIDEGAEWWVEVQAEMIAVVNAPSLASASSVIEWWHHDWTTVRDSARAAAGRIRRAAKGVLVRVR